MQERMKTLPAERISPADSHCFFGYYDAQPWNASEKYHLAHRTPFMDRLQVKGDICEVGFIEAETGEFTCFDKTEAWNFQQGAMLMWSYDSPEDEVIYNTLTDKEYCGVVRNIQSGHVRYLEKPIANLSPKGEYALSINFSRMYNFRPGYGYASVRDPFYDVFHSEDDGVFLVNTKTGKAKLILSLAKLWDFAGDYFEDEKKMVINHITMNPDGTRFVMLLRNFPKPGGKHITALITADLNGENLYLLGDWGTYSHYFWIDERQLLIYADMGKKPGIVWNTFVLKDRTPECRMAADGFFMHDHHMSLSPDRRFMLTDSYPDKETRMQYIRLWDIPNNECYRLGEFYGKDLGCTDIRCDLHPRWNRGGRVFTFDSIYEGFRGIYKMNTEIFY